MTVVTKPFSADDAEAFRRLHRQCLAHYGLAPATPEQEERVLALLCAERHMSCHLAFHVGEPAGFATWNLSFPAGAGVSLVMKELFVGPNGRRRGVGKALLSALVDVARQERCVRIDWGTDGANTSAQRFYHALGAPQFPKLNYRVSAPDFATFQARLNGG